MLLKRTQNDLPVCAMESLGREEKDAKARAADILELGEINDESAIPRVDLSLNLIFEDFCRRRIELSRQRQNHGVSFSVFANVHDLRHLRHLFDAQEISISLHFVVEAIHKLAHEMDSESADGPFF